MSYSESRFGRAVRIVLPLVGFALALLCLWNAWHRSDWSYVVLAAAFAFAASIPIYGRWQARKK
jgi:hypothetical protein